MAVDEQHTRSLEIRTAFDPAVAEYKKWDDDLIRLVKASIMPVEATNADTYFLLELAGRYGLDPFAREIWAAKMKGRQGEAGGVTILVGRDGLLSVAERHPEYRGFRNQPIYTADEFKYASDPREMPDGTWSHVSHAFDVTAGDERGELVGAWAEVYREGRPTVFFYAPLHDYLPTSERKLQYSPWATMKHVMISKCALATALRLAFRITGLYIEEEMTQALTASSEAVYQESAWPEDEELGNRLKALFAAAEEARPGSWLPGKVTARLEQCGGPEDFAALEDELEDEIVRFGGTLPAEGSLDEEFDRAPTPVEDEPVEVIEEAEFEAVDEEPGEPEQQTLES